jgi:hypothetical protein
LWKIICITPSAREIANIDSGRLSASAVEDLVPLVAREFEWTLGRLRAEPVATAALNQETSEKIIERTKRILNSRRSMGWPEESLEEFEHFGSEVVFRGERRTRGM